MKAFVEYYKREAISPVSQDISDFGKHLRRRDALYRHLGIVPGFVKGRRVLEFGPGSGFNSVHTAQLEPAEYVLVEANPNGIKKMKEVFADHLSAEQQSRMRIENSYIEEFQSDQGFDLVLCEALLPTQEDPHGMLEHVASFVAPGGTLVITCSDGVSYLAEQLRRLIACLVTDPQAPTKERVEVLMPLFSPHLATIEGMNRPHDEWILDNVVQPFTGGKLFAISDAISVVRSHLSFYNASPNFMLDWRWYKRITDSPDAFNDWGLDAFETALHNFLDCRTEPSFRDAAKNRELLQLCSDLFYAIIDFETKRKDADLNRAVELLGQVADQAADLDPLTAESVQACHRIVQECIAGKREDFDWGPFAGWFGQAQQYVSFIRYQ